MKNAIIALLALALVIVSVFAFRQTAALSTQGQELRAALAAKSGSDSLDLQAKCAKQAAEAFKHERLDTEPLASYRSHYSAAAGKCFVRFSNLDGKDKPQVDYVLDAFEFKEYGMYSRVRAVGQDPYVTCTVTLPSGQVQSCKTVGEFNDLIAPYMER